MSPANPPRLASWLLDHFASASRKESLSGDLAERYQRAPSAVWYWRQVLMAIVVGAVHDIRQRTAVTVLSVVAYFGTVVLLGIAAARLYRLTGVAVWNWTVAHDLDTVRVLWFGTPWVPSVPFAVIMGVNSTVAGWLVTRLSGRRVPSLALVCGVCAFLVMPAQILWVGGAAGIGRWSVHRPYYVAVTLLLPFCTMFGGALGMRPGHLQEE